MWTVSIVTPGPIVDDTVTDFRYFPLAAGGFALTTLSTSVWALSIRLCGGKDVLPTGAWIMPVLSRRNVTSTVSSNFAYFTFWMSGIASSIEYCRSPTAVAAAVYFLPCFPMGHSPFFDWRFATRDFKATNRPSRTQSQITNRKSHMSSASADDIDS